MNSLLINIQASIFPRGTGDGLGSGRVLLMFQR